MGAVKLAEAGVEGCADEVEGVKGGVEGEVGLLSFGERDGAAGDDGVEVGDDDGDALGLFDFDLAAGLGVDAGFALGFGLVWRGSFRRLGGRGLRVMGFGESCC